jgi:hypothetical protein
VPPLQNKYLAFNAFGSLEKSWRFDLWLCLVRVFSVINEPAQQALSYLYNTHEFWAHVPTAPPPFLFLEMGISFTLHMSLTINAVFETYKGYKLTSPGVFPLFKCCF